MTTPGYLKPISHIESRSEELLQFELIEKQGPRKDGCHGCLAPVTFCGMGATGARFQQLFSIFLFQICYFMIYMLEYLTNIEPIDDNTIKGMPLFEYIRYLGSVTH